MSTHPAITIYLAASLNCSTCKEPVSVERLMGAGEEARESVGYVKADLLAQYHHHQLSHSEEYVDPEVTQ